MLHRLQMGPLMVLTTLLLDSKLQAAFIPGAVLPAAPCFFWRCHIYQHCVFLFELLQLAYLHCSTCPIWLPSANAALPLYPRFQTSYPFSAHIVPLPFAPSPPSHVSGYFPISLASFSPPDLFKVLQSIAEGLQARSTKLLHFISSYPVDLICIQESNLNLPSFFRILGHYAL